MGQPPGARPETGRVHQVGCGLPSLQKKVSYLGYDVSEEGIYLTSKFIDQVRDWPTPTSGAELASMLGFFGYYRESLPQYSELTAEMNDLKSRRKWTGGEWTPKMQRDFETLKRLFVQDGGPMRAHPIIPDGGDAGEFVLTTDWSAQAMLSTCPRRTELAPPLYPLNYITGTVW